MLTNSFLIVKPKIDNKIVLGVCQRQKIKFQRKIFRDTNEVFDFISILMIKFQPLASYARNFGYSTYPIAGPPGRHLPYCLCTEIIKKNDFRPTNEIIFQQWYTLKWSRTSCSSLAISTPTFTSALLRCY